MPMRESWQKLRCSLCLLFLIVRIYIHRGEQVANTPESEQIFLSLYIYINIFIYLYLYI